MNNRREIIEAIAAIVIVVAKFLLETERALKAIELCKESLVLLNNQALSIKQQLDKLYYIMIYKTMFFAYHNINEIKNAIICGRKLLVIYHECGKTVEEGLLTLALAEIYESQNNYVEAKELYERAVSIVRKNGNKKKEAIVYVNLATVSVSLGHYVKAKKFLEKALAIKLEISDRAGEAKKYGNLGAVFASLGDVVKAKEYLEKALEINMKIGDRAGEAKNYGNLGVVFQSLGSFVKAKDYLEKEINIELGDRTVEALSYANLGRLFESLGDRVKAKEFLEKALVIFMEIGDRAGEAKVYRNLGDVFESLCKYIRAKEYLEKALAIYMEIGDKVLEAVTYGKLGNVFWFIAEWFKAEEYLRKALAINMEIGNRAEEAENYGALGKVFTSLGDYIKAETYLEKSFTMNMEIGNRAGIARYYISMGDVFKSLGDHVKAKEYLEKAVAIFIEIGDRKGEAGNYLNLGNVLKVLGNYVKCKEYFEKALGIYMKIGIREGVAITYTNLGYLFQSLGENVKALEYMEKALKIYLEIDDRAGEALSYKNLGTVNLLFRQFRKSKEYFEKALTIAIEIGDRAGEAALYYFLGDVFQTLGDNTSAKNYYEEALVITTQIGDRKGEAGNNAKLGALHLLLGEHVIADKYVEKAISISKDTRNTEAEYWCYCLLSVIKLSQGKLHEAFSCLFQSIEKSEELRGFNSVSDQIKISIADKHVFPYRQLSGMLVGIGDTNSVLYVAELGRARALADLMAGQYSVEKHISANQESQIGIEKVMTKESNCICLYISYHDQQVLLWVLKTSGETSFREKTVSEKTLFKALARPAENLDEFFGIMVKNFRSFGILPKEVCEDRSFSDTEQPQYDSSQEESLAALQRGKDGEDPEQSLTLLHEMLIKPVSDLLEEPEIIIVPDRNLYRIPFAALLDESGKYLSETFRIRLVPSLTTMKLIQDSPVDYHSQIGALIVGDPDVGKVLYKGRLKNFVPLPGARKEAEMVGRLLGVQPLLGEDATKQVVLQRIASASLIHFAAHGNAEGGEIVFAPPSSTTRIPQEEDFLLKMFEVSKVQLRAKLVVLSCCHSGRGQIRAEGVVGIARAFLGSGARSVLVALWALEDSATEKLMSCFYENLVRGVSASESLHEAMKWMRNNGFTKVSEWAPFMLIGDNVTFDIVKLQTCGNKEDGKELTSGPTKM